MSRKSLSEVLVSNRFKTELLRRSKWKPFRSTWLPDAFVQPSGMDRGRDYEDRHAILKEGKVRKR